MIAVLTLVAAVLLFSLTIFVHELGHFLVARRCGMVVETFSIGFGPAIWSRRIRGVRWKLGALPFGGYVALPQMEPGGGATEGGAQPPPAAPHYRIAVALAGAVANLLLAFLAAVAIYLAAGRSASHREPVVGSVATNSPAWSAGLRIGDRILDVNGSPVRTWDDVMVNAALNEELRLRVQRPDGTTAVLRVRTSPTGEGVHVLEGVEKATPCLVIGTFPGQPADLAGIRRRDIIRELDGEPIYSIEQFVQATQRYRDREVPLVVEREGRRLTLTVRPVWNPAFGRVMIGIEMNRFDLSMKPLAQLRAWAAPVFRVLRALGSRTERGHAVRSVGGPLYIFQMYWMAARTSVLLALWVTGLLNVNLAILNLLPLPVLDGGHIVLAAWEGLTRRPVPAPLVAAVHRVFGLLLIGLLLLITIRDVGRLSRRPESARPAGSEPAPGTAVR
ncbi:MAG: RIP metalloprotease RseP [Kiritimatiellae bacterium]|nr:RIP metalloprotease RseP [Kiritimatiellia bacterium]